MSKLTKDEEIAFIRRMGTKAPDNIPIETLARPNVYQGATLTTVGGEVLKIHNFQMASYNPKPSSADHLMATRPARDLMLKMQVKIERHLLDAFAKEAFPVPMTEDESIESIKATLDQGDPFDES